MIHAKKEIQEAIHESFSNIIYWFEYQDDKTFDKGPEGKWASSQHLHHLIKSANPLNKALRIPKFLIRYKFGKPNRPLRNYNELVNRYNEKLAANIGVAPAGFQPDLLKAEHKKKAKEDYKRERDRLVKILHRWNEKALDRYLLPHPLLGKLSVREMCFFTIYHNYHHLKILEEKYN